MRLRSWVSAVGMICVSVTGASIEHEPRSGSVTGDLGFGSGADAPAASGDGLQRGPVNITDDDVSIDHRRLTGREIERSSAASLADLSVRLAGRLVIDLRTRREPSEYPRPR